MTINRLSAILASTFLAEGVDDTGCDSLNLVRSLVDEVDGTEFDYEEGVCSVVVTGPENAMEFIEALDDEDCVEAYDVSHDGEDVDDDADIMTLPEDTQFGFIIYLDGESVTYGGSEVNGEDLDESIEGVRPFSHDAFGTAIALEEVKRTIRVNFKGRKRVKMQCPPGFRFNAEKKSCEKIGGEELAKKRKSSIRALITRKAGGQSLKKRALIRTKKALKFRKAMGLK